MQLYEEFFARTGLRMKFNISSHMSETFRNQVVNSTALQLKQLPY